MSQPPVIACMPGKLARKLQSQGEMPSYYTSIEWGQCSSCDQEIAIGPKLKKVHEETGTPYLCMTCAAVKNPRAKVSSAQ